MKSYLVKTFKAADSTLIDHVLALISAFDTAAVFCVSFGIGKFQLAQASVKLVGEIVGRAGRSPNPEIVAAVKK